MRFVAFGRLIVLPISFTAFGRLSVSPISFTLSFFAFCFGHVHIPLSGWVSSGPRPDVALEAKRLRRKLPKGGRMSLRDVAAELAKRGHLNERGNLFSPSVVQSMLA